MDLEEGPWPLSEMLSDGRPSVGREEGAATIVDPPSIKKLGGSDSPMAPGKGEDMPRRCLHVHVYGRVCVHNDRS